MLENPHFQSFNYFCNFLNRRLYSCLLHECLLSLQYIKLGVPVGENEARLEKIQFIISSEENIFKDGTCTFVMIY